MTQGQSCGTRKFNNVLIKLMELLKTERDVNISQIHSSSLSLIYRSLNCSLMYKVEFVVEWLFPS